MTLSVPPRALIVAILTSLLLSATAIRCPKGKFIKNGACQKCRPGTYQDKGNQVRCRKCPANTYTPFFGVVSVHLCLECPEDSTSRAGSASCKKCRNDGLRRCGKCIFCPLGSEVVDCKCQKCTTSAKGPFLTQSGDLVELFATAISPGKCILTSCPDGLRATSDRTGCEDPKCPVGKQWMLGGCSQCLNKGYGLRPKNYFRNASMIACEYCPRRTTVVTANIYGTYTFLFPQDRCITCPPGQFITDYVVTTQDLLSHCKPCPEGHVTRGFGKVLCRRKGAPCPSYFFEDADGDCETCDADQRYLPEEKRCLDCADDEFSDGLLSKECRKCGGGRLRIRDYSGVKCLCPPGKVFKDGECKYCPAGTYRSERTEETCLRCSYSQYSRVGADECIACPEGTSSRFTKGKKCEIETCPEGYVFPPYVDGASTSSFGDHICVSGTNGCPKGMIGRGFSDKHSQFVCKAKKKKIVCPEKRIFDGVDNCIRCKGGTRLVQTSGVFACEKCPVGHTSYGGLESTCFPCTERMFRTMSHSSCNCRGDKVRKNGKCQKCQRGSVLVNDPLEGKICVKCRAGTFWKDADSCAKCPVNTTSLAGATRCSNCPNGTRTYEVPHFITELNSIGDANCSPV